MTDIKTLRQLVKLMVQNELTELDLQDENERISLKRGGGQAPPPPPAPAAPAPQAATAPKESGGGSADSEASGDEGLVPITSPMVGTFYASPNPDAAPFVQPGDRVSEETVVCIIEAMKVFNEIKAETPGTVERVCVESGQTVEFGEPLFMLRP